MNFNQQTEYKVSEFSKWLAEMIEARGATLRQVAEYSGVSSASISDLVNANTKPSYETCLRLARYFAVDPNKVLRLGGHEPIIEHPVVPIDLADPRLNLAFARIAALPPQDQKLMAEHVILPWLAQQERKHKKRKSA